jgi:hypothetical protein
MIVPDHCAAISAFPWLVVMFRLSVPGLPPSSTGRPHQATVQPVDPGGIPSRLFFRHRQQPRKGKYMTNKFADPIHALALSATIDVLRGMLGEAIDYLNQEKHLAALGTLILFYEQSEDVKAAIRLFRRDVQSDGRRK